MKTFYEKKDLLVKGVWGLGSVYTAKLKKGLFSKSAPKAYDDTVAVKVIPKIASGYSATEAELLKYVDFRHPNIVRYLKCLVKPEGKIPCYHLYMELCSSDMGKELEKRREEKIPLNEEEFRNIFVGVASGLQHLHNQGLMHRDVKPNNILLKSEKEGDALANLTAKLCDFGVSKLGDGNDATLTRKVGTMCYRSPEVLRPHKNKGSARYGLGADIFSCGTVMYEAITLTKLVENEDTISETVQMKLDAMPDNKFKILITKCLKDDPQERPSAENLGLLVGQIAPAT